MPVRENTTSLNAAVLGPGGLQALDVNRAMGEVRAALSTNGVSSQDVYAVLVYGKYLRPSEFNPLTTVNAVLKAYWKAWRSLSRLNVSPSPKPFDLRKISVPGASDLCVYLGSANAKEVQKKMNISEGVYVILSHLDASLLGSMELPALPEPFGELPVVIQLKTAERSANKQKDTEEWNPWNSLARHIAIEDKAKETERDIQKDTLDWRKEFMAEYECWTSAEVARQSGSTARNAAAIASRWLGEGKIFSLRFRGKTWFPRFQFEGGNPIPAVASVIRALPKHSSGWDLAFFFTNPNPYIAGRKPIELLKRDPERVQSLAQSFANPADVF